MKIKFTAFYYIMTELEVLMDSRAKNMMMVSYDADNEQLVWEVISIEEDPNKYSYSNATTSNPGPFTIYEGTTEPSSSLGKPGDIYFKHN